MGKSKKRKFQDIEARSPLPSHVRPYSSPLDNHRKHHISRIDEAPQERRIIFSDPPFRASDDDQKQRSGTPSPSSFEGNRQFPSSHKHQSYHNRHNAMPPPKPFRQGSTGHGTANSPSLGRQEDNRQEKQKFKPTLISPPVDPRSDHLTAVQAQNKNRGTRYQMFTAQAPIESESETEVKATVQESDDVDDIKSSSGLDEEIDTQASTSTSNTGTDSGDASGSERSDDGSSSKNTESDVEESDMDQVTKHQIKKHGRRNKELKAKKTEIRQAAIGKDAVEKLQRKEKAKMEKATKRAIFNLHSSSPQKMTATTLSKHDQTLLESIQSLIPHQILSSFRPTRASDFADTSGAKPSNPNKAQQQSYLPSDLTTTLNAARILILHLSGTKLRGTRDKDIHAAIRSHPSLAASAGSLNNNEANIQTELIRVAKDREMKISALESEVARLSAELEKLREKGIGKSK